MASAAATIATAASTARSLFMVGLLRRWDGGAMMEVTRNVS
jgi:hypothetical protein